METIPKASEDALARATAALDAGELVVIPADLRYVVAADALDDIAIERLLLALHHGADEGLLVLLGGVEDLHHVAYVTPRARELADRHWPGTTALALKARPWLPDAVGGGRDRVRANVPRDAFARALAKQFGPIAVARAPDALPAARVRVDDGPRPGGALVLVDASEAEAKVIRDGTPGA